MPVDAFLDEIEAHLKSGIATELSYRPALARLFDDLLAPAKATNEPKREAYGAPDFVIQHGQTPVGHVEAKDVGVDLAKVIKDSERATPSTDNGKQLKRYRAALPNLLYTDGLEWHWFVGGAARREEPLRVATWNRASKKLERGPTAVADLQALLSQFAAQRVSTVSTPRDLAQRLAQTTRWLHDVIVQIFKHEGEGELHQQLKAFRQTLLPMLTPDDFADMYAQTIVYGLFAARVAAPDRNTFTRFDAARAIPRTNPFLRKLFQEVAGYDLDDRIAWLVDNCAHLLAHTEMDEVLKDFGKATRQEDPVVHFYETFLAAYDPKLRESRGVYYTPEPVVSYIVRSVDALLRTRFNRPLGLADDKTIVLDPATGTATFLHTVVQQIHAILVDHGLGGSWNSYVPEKLLPRLFGFELLMAPYTMAHLKVGLLLSEFGYHFGSDERLGIYLTNTLADAPSAQQPLAFAQFIAAESQAANAVKHEKPVMVVLGNPPYSGISENMGAWIDGLLKGLLPDGTRVDSYYEVDGQPLGEKKLWLQDDYVKFIRFGQWRVNRTGEGILALITNNGYLDNPTFRGMRQSLLHEFDKIYLLNLHGNSKKKEKTPEGSPDENVFDIQQGVTIGIFVKETHSSRQATVYYSDLWGTRESKYELLSQNDVEATNWLTVVPNAPYYFFVPRREDARQEYEVSSSVNAVFPANNAGIITARDHFVMSFSEVELLDRIGDFINGEYTDDEIRAKYFFGRGSNKYAAGDSRGWRLAEAREKVRADSTWQEHVRMCLYRPFDNRSLYYVPWMVDWPRPEVMRHMLAGPNVGIATTRSIEIGRGFEHVFCSDTLIQHHTVSIKEVNYLFPLYVYPLEQPSLLDVDASGPGGRRPNLSPTFIADVEQRLGLEFVSDGKGDLQQTVGPEDIFHYTYAIFHSPTYRQRYAEFLKIDFPRLPLTSNRGLFAGLAAKGAELVDLHLLRLPGTDGVGGAGGAAVLVSPGKQGLRFPKGGTNRVDKAQYIAPHDEQPGRVTINNEQYFEGIEPDTWEMHIGGYQPLDKWLKDRKGRTLSFDDVQHYLRMAIALRETRRIMGEIDGLIPAWPLR